MRWFERLRVRQCRPEYVCNGEEFSDSYDGMRASGSWRSFRKHPILCAGPSLDRKKHAPLLHASTSMICLQLASFIGYIVNHVPRPSEVLGRYPRQRSLGCFASLAPPSETEKFYVRGDVGDGFPLDLLRGACFPLSRISETVSLSMRDIPGSTWQQSSWRLASTRL